MHHLFLLPNHARLFILKMQKSAGSMVLRNQQTDALIFYMLFFRCEPLGVSTSSSFQNPPETLGSHPYKSPQKVAKKL